MTEDYSQSVENFSKVSFNMQKRKREDKYDKKLVLALK